MKASPTYDVRNGDVAMFSGLTYSRARAILVRVRRRLPHVRLVKLITCPECKHTRCYTLSP